MGAAVAFGAAIDGHLLDNRLNGARLYRWQDPRGNVQRVFGARWAWARMLAERWNQRAMRSAVVGCVVSR